jgi:hypothetical protein
MAPALSGVGLAILVATLIATFGVSVVATDPPPLCRYCNGSQIRCKIGQQCCNFGLKDAQCIANTLTCPSAVTCDSTQEKCGTACNGVDVWCPVGQVCCNPCQGANICTLPGGTCNQDCPGC